VKLNVVIVAALNFATLLA